MSKISYLYKALFYCLVGSYLMINIGGFWTTRVCLFTNLSGTESVNLSRVLFYETSAVTFVSFLVLIGFFMVPSEIDSNNARQLMLTTNEM